MTKREQKNLTGWNEPYLALCCALQALYGVLSMCFAVVLNTLASAASGTGSLVSAGVLAVTFGIVYPASRALADSVTQSYGERAAEAVRGRLDRAIVSMDSIAFAQEDTGDYLNKMTGDVLLLRDQYYTQIPLLFAYATQFAFCVVYSFYLNRTVGLLLMVMSVVQYVIPMLFGKSLNSLTVNQSKMTSAFTSKAKELLLGFSVIKSYGAEKQCSGEFDEANRKMANAREKAAIMSQIMMCTNLLVALLVIVLSVLVSGWFVLQGLMAPASLLTVFYIANRYMMPVMDFAGAYTKLKGSRGVKQRLSEFLAAHPEGEKAVSRPIIDGVEVKNVSFSYHDDAPALHNVSFRFTMGKKYLIVGESGCGKSTLLKVLAGQYPCAGVFVYGRALEALPSGVLAGQLVLVGQQPYVFHRTVAGNIDFLGTGDNKRVLAKVNDCYLSDFVASLPEGVATVVDEEQRQLSGGQKARIGLARALYTAPAVLLLDEVTSALDPETAERIERLILSLENSLVIHVSHKPSATLRKCYDAVLTMDHGEIVRVEE